MCLCKTGEHSSIWSRSSFPSQVLLNSFKFDISNQDFCSQLVLHSPFQVITERYGLDHSYFIYLYKKIIYYCLCLHVCGMHLSPHQKITLWITSFSPFIFTSVLGIKLRLPSSCQSMWQFYTSNLFV